MRKDIMFGLMILAVAGAVILVFALLPAHSVGDTVPFNKTTGLCVMPKGCDAEHKNFYDSECIITKGCN